MIYLAWIFRSMFCKHTFEYEEIDSVVRDYSGNEVKSGVKVSATCEKCGWHRKYWKFN